MATSRESAHLSAADGTPGPTQVQGPGQGRGQNTDLAFAIADGAPGPTRLAVKGTLNAITVPELRPAIDRLLIGHPSRVEIDLRELTMVDSTGVGLLISLYKRMRAQGGATWMSGLRGQPLAIFRLLRLDRVMTAPAASTQNPPVIA
jgi:anti-sigma B factor antagonist